MKRYWVLSQWPAVGAALILGALIGSFLNVVIYRLPRGESVVHPGSHCPKCRAEIPLSWNVPILSWLLLGGRCRFCRASISPRYVIVETLTAVLFGAVVYRFGWTPAAAAYALLTAALVVVTFVDLDCWEIPDEISLPGTALGILFAPWLFDRPWWFGLLGASLGALSLLSVRWLWWLWKRVEGMGLGDVKLLAMTGAFLGAPSLLPTILDAASAGTVVGLLVLAWARFAAPAPSSAEPPAPDADAAAQHPTLPPLDAPAPTPSTDDASPVDAGKTAARPDAPDTEDRDDESDEADWIPPPHAIPFGPFLALGALGYLFFGGVLFRLIFRPL